MNGNGQDLRTGGLSAEQVQFFRTFGYVVLKQYFTPDEVGVIQEEVDRTMVAQYSHKPFDGTKRHWTMMLDEETPFFANLFEDPRFLPVAQQLFGEDILGVAIDANRYVGDTRWHPDTGSLLQYGVKFAFYLQPVGATTGALRVIPGSHRFPLMDPDFAAGVRALPIEDVPAQVLASEPGDVIAFDLRLWHGSYGGSNDRRMCTVVYYNNPKTPEEVEFLRRQGEGNVKNALNAFGPQRPYIYSSAWLSNPGASPVRAHWIERLREIGYFEYPGVIQPEHLWESGR